MVDDHKIEYHLTPNGWITGSAYYFNKLQGKEVQALPNTVETWIQHTTQDNIYSGEAIEWYRTFTSSSYTDKQKTEFHAQFPKVPDFYLKDK
jgi:hypothetical protein